MTRGESNRNPTGAPRAVTDDVRDDELLARVALRDREAFRELFQLYYRRLARFLTRLTRRHDLAEEIINDTLWVVWRKASDFRRGSRVSTWIMGIAYRRGLKTLRRQQSATGGMTPFESAEEPTGDETMPAAERENWLERALEQLPVEQRMALELAYYLGYSHEEIAEIMSCPVNTVKTRMYHARQKMKALLEGLSK